ncbi:MAG: flagellar biosynthetic protein FliR [Candidatus Sericytochromatia bacterium]
MAIHELGGSPDTIESLAYLIRGLEKYVPTYFLVVSRIFGMMLQAPFFSGKALPTQGRAAFMVGLSMMYMLTIKPYIEVPNNIFMFTIMFIEEALIGMLFGFAAYIISASIQAAGEIIDVQMGMSMVTLFNPMTKSQSSAMGRLFFQLELTVFIILNAHLFLLAAFFKTFDLVPLGSFYFNSPAILKQFTEIAGQMFSISMQLAMPVLLTLFIIDFSLGITNKVSPQINVLELNFAMKPTTGMLILLIIMSSFITVLDEFSEKMIKDANLLMKTISVNRPKPPDKNVFKKMKKITN